MSENTDSSPPLALPPAVVSAQSTQPPPPPAGGADAPVRPLLTPWLILAAVIVAAVLGVVAWQTLDTRLRLAETQQELARRLSESEDVAKESRLLATQARDQLLALQGTVAKLESRLAESLGQQAALETLYQELARGRDETALFEIEQAIVLAAQQLQLAANPQAALLALRTADARLAAVGRPQFIPLRKAIGRDLERLEALPILDLAGINLHLERVLTAIDTLPLAIDGRPLDPAPAAADTLPPFRFDDPESWRQMALALWQEVRALVRIQRFDRDEPPLLAPGQSYFLRENLRLRLLNARLAMLTRDEQTFRSEVGAARTWIERHFDVREAAVMSALTGLADLGERAIDVPLPSLNDSLSAIRTLSAEREQSTGR